MLQLPVLRDTSTETVNEAESFTIKGVSGTVEDPKARLAYFVKPDNSLALTWTVETRSSENWLVSYVNAEAANPEVVGVVNYISHATYEV